MASVYATREPATHMWVLYIVVLFLIAISLGVDSLGSAYFFENPDGCP